VPTTQPLDPGDDAEGQLKPIAEFKSAPSPQPASRPAAQPQQPKPQPQPQQVASRPVAQGVGVRTTLHAPSLSLNRKHVDANSATQTQSVAHGEKQARLFTDDELTRAWTDFIENHAKDHLLINTMRVSHPQRTAVANTFEMVVESEIQVELMNESMPTLLSALRTALQNDFITIHVRANDGASSPLTWNEREVLASIIERHPSVKKFVDDLGLSLL
jgi:DNA polymerase-3 subunit gamma/tau